MANARQKLSRLQHLDADAQEDMAQVAQALTAAATAQGSAHSDCVAPLHEHLCQAVCLQSFPSPRSILVKFPDQLHQLGAIGKSGQCSARAETEQQ